MMVFNDNFTLFDSRHKLFIGLICFVLLTGCIFLYGFDINHSSPGGGSLDINVVSSVNDLIDTELLSHLPSYSQYFSSPYVTNSENPRFKQSTTTEPKIWPACRYEEYTITEANEGSTTTNRSADDIQNITMTINTTDSTNASEAERQGIIDSYEKIISDSTNDTNGNHNLLVWIYDDMIFDVNVDFVDNLQSDENISSLMNGKNYSTHFRPTKDDAPKSQSIAYIEEMLRKSLHRLKMAMRMVPESLPMNATLYPTNPQKYVLCPLAGIHVILTSNNSSLFHGVDETYNLTVPPPTTSTTSTTTENYVTITATTVYGAMYGLQSFRQLLEFGWMEYTQVTVPSEKPPLDWVKHQQDAQQTFLLKTTPLFLLHDAPIRIIDGPAFPFRGLMIDTSRHYLPLQVIRTNLDAMEMNKLNVLHWHLTDRNSWPYESRRYPELSTKGAYCPTCLYTYRDIQSIIEDAADRGIRTIIEVDVPGHINVIGKSHPEWLSDCNGNKFELLDVTLDSVYDFVFSLYSELSDLCESASPTTAGHNWIHVGGDEVHFDCWQSNARIMKWIEDNHISGLEGLLNNFELRLLNHTTAGLGKRPIVWQERYGNPGLVLPIDTVIDIWKNWNYRETLIDATNDGYDVVFSACWYLDNLRQKWEDFYLCNPWKEVLSDKQRSHIIGGHSSMWAEKVDEQNFFARVYPRTSAMAERLWSNPGQNLSERSNNSTRIQRMNRFRCAMIQQSKITVSPLEPGTCFSVHN